MIQSIKLDARRARDALKRETARQPHRLREHIEGGETSQVNADLPICTAFPTGSPIGQYITAINTAQWVYSSSAAYPPLHYLYKTVLQTSRCVAGEMSGNLYE